MHTPNTSQALRIFHGPGQGEGPWALLSIDQYGEYAWVSVEAEELPAPIFEELKSKLRNLGFKGASIIYRQKKGVETLPSQLLFGAIPESFTVSNCGLQFKIVFKDQRNPGLFLDLDLAREWLKAHSKDLRVLNLFSYTGSLSVAAGAGGAKQVTSVDLSKPYTEWAKANWQLNKLPEENADFIFGDVFEWLKRFKKQNRQFDIVACDPPSFSRAKSGTFSTAKDLERLHELIFDLLAPQGRVISSINSENVSRKDFMAQIEAAARNCQRPYKLLQEFSLPENYPTRTLEQRYLKGVIIQAKS